VAGAAPIRVKVLGIVLGVIILLGSFVTLQMRAVLNTALLQEIETQGIALSHHIASQLDELGQESDRSIIEALLADQLQHYSSESHNTLIASIVLENDIGIFSVGRPLTPPPDPISQPLPVSRIVENGEVLEIVEAFAEGGYRLRLGLSTSKIQELVNSVSFQLLSLTLIMVAVGFAAAFFLTWILTRPLLDLLKATHLVAQGDFSRLVPRWANDEIGDLTDAFNRMTLSLKQAEVQRQEQAQMREQYVHDIIVAQENERQRIARELHDSTSQSLTSLLIGLQSLKQSYPDSDRRDHVDSLRQTITEILDEVRTISWQLRPSVLDDLGLMSALQQHLDDYRDRYHLQVEFATRGIEDRLPLEMESAIYRIVQEGLTNIARHAQASAASVIINRRGEMIRIIIEDNGSGFDPAEVKQRRKSLGLQGIQERAALLGGQLTIETQPGQGTTLYAEIPYPEVQVKQG
jgi:signal transduction histidine kinase